MNEEKCKHITFTRRKQTARAISPNNKTDTVKNLGMHLGSRLVWKHRTRQKVEQIGNKRRNMVYLAGSILQSKTINAGNELLIYKVQQL